MVVQSGVKYLAVCDMAMAICLVENFSAAITCCKGTNFKTNGFSMLTCVCAAAPVQLNVPIVLQPKGCAGLH